MAFIRTSEWKRHRILIREKDSNGELKPLEEHTGAGAMSRDLSIKGIHVKKGGASLHNVHDNFVLKPNACVVLETREHITTGQEVLGFICSRASLASKGLVVSNLKVDPNYSDTLYITVFNAGTGSIPLRPGYPFCAVVFCQTDGPCEGQTRRPDPEGISDGWSERLTRVRPHIVTGAVTFALSVFGGIVAMLVME